MHTEFKFVAILLFWFVVFAEALSWITASWPGDCIVRPEQNQIAAHQANQQNCPTLIIGSWITLKRADSIIGRHDKSIIAVFTIVLAMSTIGLWIVTWQGSVRQSGDMQESLSHSREALTAVERAFIFLREISVTTRRNPAPPGTVQGRIYAWRFAPVWENSGRTPTRRAVTCINCSFFDGEIPADFDFPDDRAPPSKAVMGPQATFIGADITIAHNEIQRVAMGSTRMLIWGWADYDDDFIGTPRHRTEFCLELTAEPEPGGEWFIAFRPYSRFNGTDQECLRQPRPYCEIFPT